MNKPKPVTIPEFIIVGVIAILCTFEGCVHEPLPPMYFDHLSDGEQNELRTLLREELE